MKPSIWKLKNLKAKLALALYEHANEALPNLTSMDKLKELKEQLEAMIAAHTPAKNENAYTVDLFVTDAGYEYAAYLKVFVGPDEREMIAVHLERTGEQENEAATETATSVDIEA